MYIYLIFIDRLMDLIFSYSCTLMKIAKKYAWDRSLSSNMITCYITVTVFYQSYVIGYTKLA